MRFQKRKIKILEIINQRGEADVKILAEELQTSEITVRRDLALLAGEGLVLRTHGGAMKPESTRTPVGFEPKMASNQAQKEYIARLAAAEIRDGEVIFMDCGSTVFQLCPFIKDKNIKVVTNSLPVVQALLGSRVTINLAGGELDQERQAVHGLLAEEHLRRYQADRAFVGVDGISAERGLSANSELEAGITRAMIQHARRTYLLCDASKLGRESYLQFASLDQIHCLVTDADTETTQPFVDKGLRVLREAEENNM